MAAVAIFTLKFWTEGEEIRCTVDRFNGLALEEQRGIPALQYFHSVTMDPFPYGNGVL